jgi:hypothetical protein
MPISIDWHGRIREKAQEIHSIMATTTQSTSTTVLIPVTTTVETLRVKLNLKAPDGASKNEVIRFNNEIIRLAKARGFTPMQKKETLAAE